MGNDYGVAQNGYDWRQCTVLPRNKNNYPYFDRVGGRDHVVMATHDYGQCFDYKKRRTEVKQMGSEEEKAKYTNSGPLQELQNVIVL